MKDKCNFDFSTPQKLDKKALWIVLVKAVWTIARTLWPLLAIMALKGFREEALWLYVIMIGVIVLTIVRLVVQFLFYTYELKADELIIKKGWLSKSETVVKLDKIHEVNLNQKLIHKLVGLYNVAIDTAGSSKTEIEINGIGYEKALALKDALIATQQESIPVSNVELSEEIVNEKLNYITENQTKNRIQIGVTSLMKIGITRNYLQTFGLLFAFGYQFADQLQSFFYKEDESIYDDIYSVASQYYVGFMWMALFLGLILFIMLFNLIRTLLTYYNYEVKLTNDKLLVSYGLTDSHIVSVPANKVQLFVYSQNYFQKLMNLFEVKIHQVESNENNKKKKGIIVPGANRQELNALFRVIYNKSLIDSKKYYTPHIRLFYRNLLILSGIVSLISVGIWYQNLVEYLYAALGLYLFFVGMFYLAYTNQKLFVEDDFIILQRGVWDKSTTYLHINKVQQISVAQSYFQEKRHLGSLTLYTAGGSINASFYHYDVLQQLTNEWLYKIEKNKYPWT